MSTAARITNAIRFLTVIPVPDAPQQLMPDWMARSAAYFPLIGLGVGMIAAAVFMLGSLAWGPTIAAILAYAVSIGLTGAMHEDGLADTFDSFGGGFTVEKRLLIMKDSRIGTYGALALGIDVALRIALLAALPGWVGAAALVASHAAARTAPGFVINRLRYAGDPATMKVSFAETRVRRRELLIAGSTALCAALPLLALAWPAVLIGWVCGMALAYAMARWAQRLLGGYTGDVLGAIEQLFEIGFLLGAVAAINAAA